MSEVSTTSGIEKINELVKDIDIAMLVTMDAHGVPRSRPMGTQRVPFDGTLWFLTAEESLKVKEIRSDPRVNVSYASTGSASYLSVSGSAAVVNDRALIEKFWNPFLRAWFEGPDDPSIRLIRVDVHEAEYWDTPGGRVASLISLVKGAITGNGENMNTDHRRLEL